MPGDALIRALSGDGRVGVRALVATGLVAEAARRHATSPTASAALGRTLMGALLLAAGAKDGETVQLHVRGDGPLGSVTAIAGGDGTVRGFASNPGADPPPRRDGKLAVGEAVGRGVLTVVRHRPAWRSPYTGIVPLVSGEIATDLAHYLTESEQTPAAVALGVRVGPDRSVERAGGFAVLALPGATDEVLARIERNVRALPPPTELLGQGLGAGKIARALLEGLGFRSLGEEAPRFTCPCDRSRIHRAVTLLGRAELVDLVRKREPLDVRCEFCATDYALGPDELGALLPDA